MDTFYIGQKLTSKVNTVHNGYYLVTNVSHSHVTVQAYNYDNTPVDSKGYVYTNTLKKSAGLFKPFIG
jgi:hypothetical protein